MTDRRFVVWAVRPGDTLTDALTRTAVDDRLTIYEAVEAAWQTNARRADAARPLTTIKPLSPDSPHLTCFDGTVWILDAELGTQATPAQAAT